MGKNNAIVFPIQKEFTNLKGKVAFLGFDYKPIHFNTNNYDCYDIQLENFDINSDWKLNNNYDTIICYRTLLFCTENKYFFKKCFDFLNENGELYIDYSYGSVNEAMFKKTGQILGWIKNNIQQYCTYKNINGKEIISLCITSYWNDDFLNDSNFINFYNELQKVGYNNRIKENIINEVPILIGDDYFKKYFTKEKIKIHHWMDGIKPKLTIYLKLKKI